MVAAASLILTTSTLNSLSAREQTALLRGLADDVLEGELTAAVLADDRAVIQSLSTEKLRRLSATAAGNERLSKLRQAEVLELQHQRETWKVTGQLSWIDYLRVLGQEYVDATGGEPSEGVIVWKSYKAIEEWCSIVRHYHADHGLPLEAVAQWPSGKLQALSHACRVWDNDHDGEMDADIRQVLDDPRATKDDALVKYQKRKVLAGLPVSGNLDTQLGNVEDAEDTPARESTDGAREESAHDSATAEFTVAAPLDWLDTMPPSETQWVAYEDSGRLVAFVPDGVGHASVHVGTLFLSGSGQAKALALAFCQLARVRVA